jgi:very-short-patch-repair endonuclease
VRDVRSLAARQQGLVTRGQLVALGIDKKGIDRRVRDGRLTRLHRGVYLAAPLPAQFTPEMAAVLACGPTAVLSHHSAAALHGIRPREERDVHVTVTGGQPRSRPGIRVHRARALESIRRHGIPVTTPARTLLDLATVLPRRDLERAVEEAQLRRLVSRRALIDAQTGHHGTPALHAALVDEPRLTRSEAEAELLRLIRAAGLPTPLTNARVGRYEVDFLWPEHGLVVEMDGFAYHSSRHAFERDRLRDADLQSLGLRVIRVTWRQLQQPEALVARLAAALATARPPSYGPARTAAPGRP